MDQGHRTEAACLLEQGALYRRRIGLEPVARAGEPIFAGFKPGAFSLYFGDAPIYHFDLEGRWQRAFVDGLQLSATTSAIVALALAAITFVLLRDVRSGSHVVEAVAETAEQPVEYLGAVA